MWAKWALIGKKGLTGCAMINVSAFHMRWQASSASVNRANPWACYRSGRLTRSKSTPSGVAVGPPLLVGIVRVALDKGIWWVLAWRHVDIVRIGWCSYTRSLYVMQ